MKKKRIIKIVGLTATCIFAYNLVSAHTFLRDSIGVENQDGKKVILHRLERKESYYSLGRTYNLSPKTIIDFNANKALKAGDVIKIPTGQAFENKPSPAPVTTNTAVTPNQAPKNGGTTISSQATDFIEYKVGNKETLFAISKRFGVSVDAIKQANNLTSDDLKADQIIKIPNTPVEQAATNPNTQQRVISDEELRGTAPSNDQDTKEETQANTEETPKEDDTPTNRYGIKQVTASGIGVWMDDLNGETGKMLALHNTAPIGTVVKITNPMTNRTTYAKVVGKFNETSANKDAIIVISKSVASLIGVIDRRFRVNISY